MLGWHGNGFLPSTLSVLHIIIWKFVIISLTRIELQGDKWDTDAIWKQALHRTRTRILSHSEGARRWAMARWSKGQGIPDTVLQRWNKQVYPLATYTEDGELRWIIQLDGTA